MLYGRQPAAEPIGHLGRTASSRLGALRSREGEDLGAVVGDGDGVLEVGGAAAVGGDDGPAVVEHSVSARAGVDHGLDGEARARP